MNSLPWTGKWSSARTSDLTVRPQFPAPCACALNAFSLKFLDFTARGVMKASALYEAPFNSMHAGGPDELFAGKEKVIEGIFEKLEAVNSGLTAKAG